MQNEQIEDLVPIRLDIDWEKVKIRVDALGDHSRQRDRTLYREAQVFNQLLCKQIWRHNTSR
jgi:hypothetical protein